METSSDLNHESCGVCGFATSLYGLESDLTSTAALASHIVGAAAEDLDDDTLHASHDGHSIAELVEASAAFTGSELDVAHHGLHTMAMIGDVRASLGHGPTPGSGEVTGLFASGGGVPKTSIESAEISPTGVAGDAQNNRIHHGRPLQALCLWSADVIESLNAEGHRVRGGMAGENITVKGLDWKSMRPGCRLTVGDIEMLITSHATPCSKIADGFADRAFARVDHDDNPGWSRLYAIPLGTGTLTTGSRVTVG